MQACLKSYIVIDFTLKPSLKTDATANTILIQKSAGR